jgi:hypothetical protein
MKTEKTLSHKKLKTVSLFVCADNDDLGPAQSGTHVKDMHDRCTLEDFADAMGARSASTTTVSGEHTLEGLTQAAQEDFRLSAFRESEANRAFLKNLQTLDGVIDK